MVYVCVVGVVVVMMERAVDIVVVEEVVGVVLCK